MRCKINEKGAPGYISMCNLERLLFKTSGSIVIMSILFNFALPYKSPIYVCEFLYWVFYQAIIFSMKALNHGLKKLNLQWNSIVTKGAVSLAAALKVSILSHKIDLCFYEGFL